MSTRAAIGRRLENGKIHAIYCHFDGYPGGVGATLGAWYNTPERVKDLLDLGSLSVLGRELAPAAGTYHSYDKPQNNVTIAYHRDRNEPLNHGITYDDLDDYEEKGGRDFGAEYLYLFENGIWKYYPIYGEHEWVTIEVILGN